MGCRRRRSLPQRSGLRIHRMYNRYVLLAAWRPTGTLATCQLWVASIIQALSHLSSHCSGHKGWNLLFANKAYSLGRITTGPGRCHGPFLIPEYPPLVQLHSGAKRGGDWSVDVWTYHRTTLASASCYYRHVLWPSHPLPPCARKSRLSHVPLTSPLMAVRIAAAAYGDLSIAINTAIANFYLAVKTVSFARCTVQIPLYGDPVPVDPNLRVPIFIRPYLQLVRTTTCCSLLFATIPFANLIWHLHDSLHCST